MGKQLNMIVDAKKKLQIVKLTIPFYPKEHEEGQTDI